eukprot:m.18017 g.18017  ORF g.18017 m.18017 type:complete len:102 (+) comp29829_c0_seq1:179-484(+)
MESSHVLSDSQHLLHRVLSSAWVCVVKAMLQRPRNARQNPVEGQYRSPKSLLSSTSLHSSRRLWLCLKSCSALEEALKMNYCAHSRKSPSEPSVSPNFPFP